MNGKLPPPTAIVEDRETGKQIVLKLVGAFENVPVYKMVAGRVFELRQDAVKSAVNLAAELESFVESP